MGLLSRAMQTIASRDFNAAKAMRAEIEDILARSSTQLKGISGVGSGPMGLTPDTVRATPEWRSARTAYDEAFGASRAFNQGFNKTFETELKSERQALARQVIARAQATGDLSQQSLIAAAREMGVDGAKVRNVISDALAML